MSLRCVPLSLVLISFGFAADQPANPVKADAAGQSPAVAKADDPSPADKTDSQASGRRTRPHIRFGGFVLGAGYSRFSGGYPYEYGPGYFGYPQYYGYDPFLWSPFYYPGFFTGFGYGPGMGNVKIQVPDKTALVFLDGGLAGRLEQLKNMWLKPGVYQLEVRDSNHRFTRKIYVLSGKTLKVTPDMMTKEAPE
ncbi:MAG: hypothetical protein LAQ69_07310 [Acidobacteriia bacterium]|nr:hypothetical protein [Terriglobia bacterium]